MSLKKVNDFDYVTDSMLVERDAKQVARACSKKFETTAGNQKTSFEEQDVCDIDTGYLVYVVITIVTVILYLVVNLFIFSAIDKEIQQINAEVIEEASKNVTD